jgi:AcrR family transcriptional regulator
MIGANVQPSTKARILDAAERLFTENGFDGTSLRLITSAAEVNLAAVNYHFHSKDALIEAVFARRIGPLNQRRLEMLEACLAHAGSGPLPLEEVIRAFVAPIIRMRQEAIERGADFAPLFGRMYSDPSGSAKRSFLGQMRKIAQPFTDAFGRALPETPLGELLWRIYFTIGVIAHTLAGGHHLLATSRGLCDASDTEGLIERMVAFVAAGMRAPLPAALHRS